MNAHDVAARLPDIERLRQRCKALAVLERVIDGTTVGAKASV
ncbi:hypothetical protein AB0C50_14990 [Micromonospora taraxaci]